MATKINFDDFANIEQDGIVVTGTSQPINPAAQLVTRRVSLRQLQPDGTVTYAEGAATPGPTWESEPPLASAGFTTGAALASGTETHVMGGPSNADGPATLVTVTWSQSVELR